MDVVVKRPGLRWMAPLLVLAVVATAGLIGTRASADVTLPTLTAQQLLTKVGEARPAGFSGTVEQTANLGLPDLSDLGGQDNSDFSSLVSGTHTLRVAYAAPDKSRIAVNGTYGESDLISDGTQQWLWSSEKNTVVHRTGDAVRARDDGATPPTPADAASRFLDEVGTSTDVTLAKNVTVALRPSYELVLTPKSDQTGTLISSVRLAVDGETFVPLRAELYAVGSREAVFSTAFTTIDYTVPAASEFTFTPPKDATVEQHNARADHSGTKSTTKGNDKSDRPDVTTTGDAWTTVAVSKVGTVTGNGDRQVDQVLQSLPKVSGSWGSGRLLAGTAFSAVLTDDGRLAIGTVTPELLYAALR